MNIIGEDFLYYSVKQPIKTNLCEGNPCRPSTGEKTQTEIDYVSVKSPSLNVTRTYSSQPTTRLPKGQPVHLFGTASTVKYSNWHHNYNKSVGQVGVSNSKGPIIAAEEWDTSLTHYRSQPRLSPQTVCEQVKNNFEVSSSLYNASYELVSNNSDFETGSCRAYDPVTNKTLAWYLIHVQSSFWGYSPIASNPLTREVIRPNGTVYIFSYASGKWLSLHGLLRLINLFKNKPCCILFV